MNTRENVPNVKDFFAAVGREDRQGLLASSAEHIAKSFARLAELGGWRGAELWTDAERLFAVFGLVATTPAKSV